LEWQTIPFPENISIVIADTTVRRHLTSGEYTNAVPHVKKQCGL
jgi:galactokinase